jgi:hypothetical protein
MMNGVVIHTVGDRWAATPGGEPALSFEMEAL